MKTRKFLSFALALTLASALFAACTVGDNGGYETPTPTPGPVTAVDVTGREVTLPLPARRIAGAHGPTLNIAVILGGGGRNLVGFGGENAAGSLYEYVYPTLPAVLRVGRDGEFDAAAVLAAAPDLVILPERHGDLTDMFENELGIPAAVILPDEESFAAVRRSVETLGALTGAAERAAQIIGFCDALIANARETAARAGGEPPRVMFTGASPLTVAGASTLQAEMLETAGAVNAAELDGRFSEVTIEQIAAWDPEIIYIPSYAPYGVDDILNDAAWRDISAVRDGRVYRFPGALEPWDSPAPSVVLGLSWILHNLYPDLHSLEQMIFDAQDYYNLVYNHFFTPAQMGFEI